MAENYANLFEMEYSLLKRAKDLMGQDEYDKEILLNNYKNIVEQYDKLVTDMKKMIKISDGQQEYLHKIQSDLKKEIESRMRAEEKLRYIAAIDTLTGCYNRGMGLRLLEEELNSIRRNQGLFSFCYIDVNGLKYVNDHFGHFEGDEFLVAVCRFIKAAIGEKDILCRLGGDEFVIIFPNSPETAAEDTLRRIYSEIEEQNHKKLKPYPISFSHGIVQVNWDDKWNIDEIIQRADERMYECKQKYGVRSV